MLPTILVKILKENGSYVKYINVISAALFVTLISITLTYHVVVIYVYPIAIASLYFSKLVNTVATIITVVGVSLAQIIAFYADTLQDKNYTTLYGVIIYGIIPRALVLTAVAVIFTMLCSRTMTLLSKLMAVVEEKSKYHKEMVMGFATLVENKDGSTGGHIKRTTAYVRLLSEELISRGHYKDVLTKEYVENLCQCMT